MKNKQRKTKNFFLKIKCDDCKNEQTTFSAIAMPVTCLVCGKTLALPGSHKIVLKNAKIVKPLK